MRILITGSTGFIGWHVTERLIREGHTVVCHTRSQHPVLPQGALSTTSLTAVRFADRVYHIAGVLGGKGIPESTYRVAHVDLTHDILMRMERGQQFLYMSSAYALTPDSLYSRTKLEGESVVRELAPQDGIDFSIVRPGFVFGERDKHMMPLFRMVKRLGRWFPIIGSGDNLICPTYVGDVVDAVMGVRFGGDVMQVCGEPVTMRNFISNVADAIGVERSKVSVKWVPGWMRDAVRCDFFTRDRVFWSDWKCRLLQDGLMRTVLTEGI
jgi:nucleoside-diphosphate-sugar epimerase